MLKKQFLDSSRGRIAALLQPGGLTAEEIAAKLQLTTNAVRAQLAGMERDGLVRRERDPADQRRTVVEATAKGRKLVEKLSATVEAHYQFMEQAMGKQKLAQLYALLDELIDLERPQVQHRRELRVAKVPA